MKLPASPVDVYWEQMLQNPFRVALWLLAFVSGAVASTPADTARLAAHLKATRRGLRMPADDFATIQAEYLAWIDARVRAGEDIRSMNRELRAAGLIPRPTPAVNPTVEEIYANRTGYLDEISAKPVRRSEDVLVFEAGIYKGANCQLDVTAVLYQRSPLRRLAYINAQPSESESAEYLSGLDVGEKDADGARLVASGWVASNCASAWNGKGIRIDRLNGTSVENILTRGLAAHDRFDVETVAARVQRDVVTFWFDGGIFDSNLLLVPAVARYRIVGNHAVREGPVALTRAGFIVEWLQMADDDAIRWGEPEAARLRKAAAAAIEKHGIKFEQIARCGGSPVVWEVAERINEAEKLYVFRIAGSRATELRMVAVGDKVTRSCTPIDIHKGFESVGGELPW